MHYDVYELAGWITNDKGEIAPIWGIVANRVSKRRASSLERKANRDTGGSRVVDSYEIGECDLCNQVGELDRWSDFGERVCPPCGVECDRQGALDHPESSDPTPDQIESAFTPECEICGAEGGELNPDLAVELAICVDCARESDRFMSAFIN